jgi:murein DD-endopeptidase MepM/ murein hydrolase activator NlpD
LLARDAYKPGGLSPRLKYAAAGAGLLLFLLAVYFLLPRGESLPELPEGPEVRLSSGPVSAPLDTLLAGAGLDPAARAGVVKALSKKLNPRRLTPADTYCLTFSTGGALLQAVVTRGLNEYTVVPSSGGRYDFSVVPVELTVSSRSAKGAIATSLWEAMSASGVPPGVILDYADIFSWSVDFLTEVRAGDAWAVAWTQKTDPSGKSVAQTVTAAYYKGSETGDKSAARHNGNYYDEKGDSLRSMFLRAPLQYRRISSHFTNRRFHPVLKYFRPHHGIDYAAATGTPVSAVADGTVTFAGWKGGNGKLVIVRHGAGYETTYGHLSRYGRGVRAGRRVGQGDVIGYVGSTGLSSGPHLDFRIKLHGKPLNFLKIKYRAAGGVSGKAREAVRAAIAALPQ